ncbi:MAG TPA: hypothetical protein VK203_22475 [Nostocaceae cyanobacterium]|nr:hypothetical protein [Nostocaceae cyanobacterium]
MVKSRRGTLKAFSIGRKERDINEAGYNLTGKKYKMVLPYQNQHNRFYKRNQELFLIIFAWVK